MFKEKFKSIINERINNCSNCKTDKIRKAVKKVLNDNTEISINLVFINFTFNLSGINNGSNDVGEDFLDKYCIDKYKLISELYELREAYSEYSFRIEKYLNENALEFEIDDELLYDFGDNETFKNAMESIAENSSTEEEKFELLYNTVKEHEKLFYKSSQFLKYLESYEKEADTGIDRLLVIHSSFNIARIMYLEGIKELVSDYVYLDDGDYFDLHTFITKFHVEVDGLFNQLLYL